VGSISPGERVGADGGTWSLRSGEQLTIAGMELATMSVTPERELERVTARERRYELGQFFTPEPIARFMADAVLAIDPATVLDPGVGGGVLLRAVGTHPRRFGCDIDPIAVELASASLAAQGGESEIVLGNFLDAGRWPLAIESFDAVIANPPYIRHHNLSSEQKRLARRYGELYDIEISSLSGSYAYFFFEAIRRLRDGGRLVFITPTEFLDVRYGAAIKAVLRATCEIEEIVVLEMDELAFDGVLTTSAITIATKRTQPSRSVRLREATFDGHAVRPGRAVVIGGDVARDDLPWTPLLPSRAERVAPLLKGRTAQLGDSARVRRGIASGDNSFFCLTQRDVERWGLPADVLVPVIVGAKDLPAPGRSLTFEHWQSRLAAGARGWLFWCHQPFEEIRDRAVRAYLEHGAARGVPDRFNCRTRRPWYGVERVPPSDFFVTYMSRERARFVRNEAGARCMTSLLNVWASPGVDVDELAVVLDDEVNGQLLREFGRTYGGGLGKIEPRDLLRLPVRPLARRLRAA
jgi:adenine-specific DNA-methyltransferase